MGGFYQGLRVFNELKDSIKFEINLRNFMYLYFLSILKDIFKEERR